MRNAFSHLESKVIHAGEPEPRIGGAVVMPIFQTAMMEYHGEASYHDVKYIRLNNLPNHLVLNQKLAAMENAEAAIVTASGMAAITTTLMTVLNAGDHLLVQENLYGGTHDFVTKDFANIGLSYDFIDSAKPDTWKQRVKPNTKAVYFESISNPLMQVPDLKAAVEFARSHRFISMIDNTFTSPVNFRPIELGFDLALHSCTKYLNGHTDIVAGACIGSKDLVTRVKHKLDHLGGSLDPHAAFLLHRGLKTVVLRVRHQNESALKIARFLESHRAVERVNYPGLESHPQHRIARELFSGFSGMLSFELKGGTEAAENVMKRVNLPIIAPSLGGVETLLTRPATTSHAGLPPEIRKKLGITDSLIRMSVGIEAAEDIMEDLNQALDSVG
jgi:cystathionine beta-lyase/cystathionine gamma-synthase